MLQDRHHAQVGGSATVSADALRSAPPARRVTQRRTWPWALAAGMVVFAALAATTSRLFLSDTYLSLYAGRFIARHGLPTTDPFTVAGHGRMWIDQQWLAHRLTYGAWQLGGDAGAGILSALLIASAFAMLTTILLRRGADPARAVIWMSVAFFVCQTNTVIRAQSFAYPLFVGLLWLLLEDERRDRYSPRLLLAVPLIAAWGNLHGSVLVGTALAVGWALWRVVERMRDGDNVSALRYGFTAVLCTLAVAVSPYSPAQLLAYYRSVLGNPVIASWVTEWLPATFGGVSTVYVIVLGLCLVVAGIAYGRGVRVLGLPLVLTAVTALAGASAVRYQVWFAFPAVIFVADMAGALQAPPPLRARRVEPRRLITVCAYLLPLLAAVLAFGSGQAVRAEVFCLFAGLIVAVDCAARSLRAGRRPWLLAGVLVVPVVACAAVLVTTPPAGFERGVSLSALRTADRVAVHRPEVRVMADDVTAPALLWHYPELAGRVGFDARLEIFSQPDLLRYVHFVAGNSPHWLSAARGYDMVVASAGQNPGLVRLMRGEDRWQALHRGHGTVFVRRS